MNSLQVYAVVDEMFLAGEIRETSQTKVLKQLLMLTSLEWPTTRHFAWSHWCNSEGLFKECGWTFLSVKWLLLNLHIWVTHFGCEKFLRQIVRRRYYCDAPSVKVADFKSDCFHFEFGRFCLWEAAFLRWFIGLFSGFFLEYMDCSKETWCFQPLKWTWSAMESTLMRWKKSDCLGFSVNTIIADIMILYSATLPFVRHSFADHIPILLCLVHHIESYRCWNFYSHFSVCRQWDCCWSFAVSKFKEIETEVVSLWGCMDTFDIQLSFDLIAMFLIVSHSVVKLWCSNWVINKFCVLTYICPLYETSFNWFMSLERN